MLIIQDLINITNICIDQFKTIRQTCRQTLLKYIIIMTIVVCMHCRQTDIIITCKLQIYIKHYFSH